MVGVVDKQHVPFEAGTKTWWLRMSQEEFKVSHVNSAGRVGALLGLADPAATGELANGGSSSTSVPDKVPAAATQCFRNCC